MCGYTIDSNNSDEHIHSGLFALSIFLFLIEYYNITGQWTIKQYENVNITYLGCTWVMRVLKQVPQSSLNKTFQILWFLWEKNLPEQLNNNDFQIPHQDPHPKSWILLIWSCGGGERSQDKGKIVRFIFKNLL